MNNKKINSILNALETKITPLLDKEAGNEFRNLLLELREEFIAIGVAIDQEKSKSRQAEKIVDSLKLANSTLAEMVKSALNTLEA